jgi:hypothetical protein
MYGSLSNHVLETHPTIVYGRRRGAHGKEAALAKVQNAIDAYAMAEGATSTSDYAAQYKRGDWIEREGTPEEVAEALLAELEEEFAKIEIPRRNGST